MPHYLRDVIAIGPCSRIHHLIQVCKRDDEKRKATLLC